MIYITGDMHGQIDASRFRFFANFMNKEDTLIVAGDFGFVWHGKAGDQRQLIKLSRVCKGTILFVAGNHENYNSLYEDYKIEDYKGFKVHSIKDNIKHIIPNQVFTLEDTVFLTVDGAYSIDREYRVLNNSWWEQEIPTPTSLVEFVLAAEAHKKEINYVISHEAPENLKAELLRGDNNGVHIPKEYTNNMTAYLDGAYDILRKQKNFKHWFFGHYHDDKTLIRNASCIYRTVELLI